MYNKILVPLDGSERAEQILPHVISAVRTTHAEVLLLQVVSPPVITDGYKSIMVKESIEAGEKLNAETLEYLTGIENRLQAKDISVSKRCETGLVVESIIKVAQEENADLIAMASHGRTGLSRVFYGSVAAGVLHKIDRPLLLIRAQI